MICDNITVSESGRLQFAGQDCVDLANEYGTPLYLMDEARIRERCRTYINAANEAFDGRAKILYASKAASFKRIYEILSEEGMGADVVSQGEIYTAMKAGFPLSKTYFHSNNKTDEDIKFAIKNGVGYFVVDNEEELLTVESEARRAGKVQDILLRLTPGVDPHTYAAITTGLVDSKFGLAIETGQAEEMTKLAIALPNVKLCGFHCHVGSQIFDSEVYLKTSTVMMNFIADMKAKYGFICEQLDIGGGYGVRYTENDPEIDIAANIRQVAEHLKKLASDLSVELPIICFEPGRSIVADAGMTLYKAGTIKKIPGYKTYVSVDGGMTDNVRFAVYGAPYTFMAAFHLNEPNNMHCSIVGRCCESGDILQENVDLPSGISRGCVIACLTTGAYHYSMASNYNRLPRPPIVMLNEGKSYVAVKRETLDDLTDLDV